eukprot:scaffold215486_cov42-Prasinocladus_malaysianus.AAC.1
MEDPVGKVRRHIGSDTSIVREPHGVLPEAIAFASGGKVELPQQQHSAISVIVCAFQFIHHSDHIVQRYHYSQDVLQSAKGELPLFCWSKSIDCTNQTSRKESRHAIIVSFCVAAPATVVACMMGNAHYLRKRCLVRNKCM